MRKEDCPSLRAPPSCNVDDDDVVVDEDVDDDDDDDGDYDDGDGDDDDVDEDEDEGEDVDFDDRFFACHYHFHTVQNLDERLTTNYTPLHHRG